MSFSVVGWIHHEAAIHRLQASRPKAPVATVACSLNKGVGGENTETVPSPPTPRINAGQWPRLIHSSRFGASAPIVVASPWPVFTTVLAGRVSRRSRIESMIVSKLE